MRLHVLIYAVVILLGVVSAVSFREEGHDFRVAFGSSKTAVVLGVYRDTFFLADGVIAGVRGPTWRRVTTEETRRMGGDHIIGRLDYSDNRIKIILPMWLAALSSVVLAEATWRAYRSRKKQAHKGGAG